MEQDGSQQYNRIPDPMIQADQIHVWKADLDSAKGQIDHLEKTLASEELEKARRFHFENDQQRYIIARGILRMILGGYTGRPPHKIQFKYNAYGKPFLITGSKLPALNFNLSHTEGVAVYAFTMDRKIGIDIERISDALEIDQISQRFFVPNEINALNEENKERKEELFFQYWTRKEAFIKAVGKGVSFPIEQVDVSNQTGEEWSPVQVTAGPRNGGTSWHGIDLSISPGYVAAVVVEGEGGPITWKEF